MTMPHERTRSLRWGQEALQEICDDALIGESVVGWATELLRAYPTPDVVLGWIQADVVCIPIDAAEAIDGTVRLLNALWLSENCPSQLRQTLKFTLRHFPALGEAKGWACGSGKVSIRVWLLPEDVYD